MRQLIVGIKGFLSYLVQFNGVKHTHPVPSRSDPDAVLFPASPKTAHQAGFKHPTQPLSTTTRHWLSFRGSREEMISAFPRPWTSDGNNISMPCS